MVLSKLSLPLATGLGLLALAAPTAPARADDPPPPQCHTSMPQCLPGWYLVHRVVAFANPEPADCRFRVTANGQVVERVGRCVAPPVPPPEPGIDCAEGPEGIACEAWPQGAQLTYAWTVSSTLTPPEVIDPALPLLMVSCVPGADAGRVNVVITAPSGAISTFSKRVSCVSQ